MFAPPIVATLAIYGVLIVLESLPALAGGRGWLQHFWVALPLGLVTYAIPLFLFLGVFAVNEKRAILVPVGGVLLATLLAHYLTSYPEEFGYEQVRLRSDLWEAIKYRLPPALLISGLAMVAARWWAPRDSDDSKRFAVPPLKPALIFFTVVFLVDLTLSLVTTHGHWQGHIWLSTTQSAIAASAIIAMCCVSAVALNGWTAILPLALIGETLLIFMAQPGGCEGGAGGIGGGTCWSLIWPYLRTQIFALAALWVISVLAGAFARDESADQNG